MLELSADKYLNKAGLLNADSRIIKVGLRVLTFFSWPIRKYLELLLSNLKTNILYYREHTLSNYWFYDHYLCEMGLSFDELGAILQIRMGNRDCFGIFIHIFS